MARLNPAQHDSIAEQFAELVVDGMDWKCMYQYVYDDLIDYYEKLDEHELKEQIDEYDEELFENVKDETVLDINNTGGKY